MRKLIIEMELDDIYDKWTSTDEQLVERLAAPTNAGVTLRLLKQCSVSGSLAILEQVLSREKKAYAYAKTKSEKNRALQNGEHLSYAIQLIKELSANDR